MIAQIKETWGSGCGKGCTFNSDGSYSAILSFGESNDLTMKMEGQLIHVIHYPHSFILDAKKWAYDYAGVWEDAGGDVRLDLKLLKSECTLQRSEGKKKAQLPCEKLSQTKVFDCRAGEVPLKDSSRDVFVCRDGDENEIVFGIGEPITKVIVGEPSVKTYFYAGAKKDEKPKKAAE